MHTLLQRLAFSSLIAFAAAPANAGESGAGAQVIHDFASDLSNGDPAVLAKVDGYIAAPPTEIEDIGFYGGEEMSAQSRVFLATVNLLDIEGHLYSFEDKYMGDLLAIWADEGLIDPEALPAEAKGVFRPFFEPDFAETVYDDGSDKNPQLVDYLAYLDDHYAAATLQIEQAIEDNSGKTLVSVDPTDGDTMFFALLAPEVAEKWLNKGFAPAGEYQAGIRAPMWDMVWEKMVYALMLPTVGDTYSRPLPEGTRKRRDDLTPAY